MESAGAFFNVEKVYKSFGGLGVINDLSFSLKEGEILGIIGPNGSGKTTLFNLASGFLKPDQGHIRFLGKEITGRRPSSICKEGMTRTFQMVKPFFRMTVMENVMAGRAYGREPSKNVQTARDEAMQILQQAALESKRDIIAAQLTLLDRKRLEIARALATRPKLLLLDEVFAGLNPREAEEALGLILQIRKNGITLMIVEHVIKLILGASDRVVVLGSGEKIFDGLPQEAIENERVIAAYLGEDFNV